MPNFTMFFVEIFKIKRDNVRTQIKNNLKKVND